MAKSAGDEKVATKGSSAAHSKIVDEILKRLGRRPDCRLWKNATGVAKSFTGNTIRFGLKGSADILGITSDGKFLAIECKTGNARQSKQQRAFEKMITAMGGRYWLARDADEIEKKISELALPAIDFKLV